MQDKIREINKLQDDNNYFRQQQSNIQLRRAVTATSNEPVYIINRVQSMVTSRTASASLHNSSLQIEDPDEQTYNTSPTLLGNKPTINDTEEIFP